MKLLTSRAKAKELIEDRIQKIDPMYAKVEKDQADFYREFQWFKNELEKWRTFNTDLLKRIFSDGKIAQDYYECSNGAFVLLNHDDYDQYQEGYKPEVSREIAFLESCIERLDLYEEPHVTGKAFEIGGTFDAFKAVTEIVRSSKRSIFVVDAFVDDRTLDLMSAKASGVALTVLTKQKSITGHLKTAAKMFAQQHGPLEIRTFEKIHDRFLVTDAGNVYQSGGSFKDLGKQVSTLLAITDPDIADATRTILNKHWAAGTRESF